MQQISGVENPKNFAAPGPRIRNFLGILRSGSVNFF